MKAADAVAGHRLAAVEGLEDEELRPGRLAIGDGAFEAEQLLVVERRHDRVVETGGAVEILGPEGDVAAHGFHSAAWRPWPASR